MQIMQKPPPAAFPPVAHVPARFLALFLLIIGLYSCAAANSSSGEPEAAVKTPLAQGGNITWIESGQNVYEVHTFTATGGTQTNAGQGFAALFSFIPSAAVTADVLVVAGGGGGGGLPRYTAAGVAEAAVSSLRQMSCSAR